MKDLVQTEAVLGVELAASPARPPPEQLQLAALHDELQSPSVSLLLLRLTHSAGSHLTGN